MQKNCVTIKGGNILPFYHDAYFTDESTIEKVSP
jgi:hypothetical protein